MSSFTSDKERYCSMKLKLKELLYDNELKQDELRKLQSELLDVYRDKEILLEQCLQYEDPLDSSNSDSESQTSDNVMSANQNQQFIKQQPLMTATPMPAATQSSNHMFHQHPVQHHQQQQVYTTLTSTIDTGAKMSTIEQNVASGNINLIQPMESIKPMESMKPMESIKPSNQIGYIPKQQNTTVEKAPNAKPKTTSSKSRSKAAPKTNQTKGATTNNKAGAASKQTTAKKQKQQTDQSSEQKQNQQPQQQQQPPATSQPQEQALSQQSHIPMIGYQPPMTILGQVQLPVSSSDQFKLVPQTMGQNLANNNIQIVSNEPITSMGDRNPHTNNYMSNQQQLQPIQHQNQVNHMVHQIHLQHPDQQQQNQHQHSPQGEIQLQNVNQFQEQHQQNKAVIKTATAKPKTNANKSRSRAAPKTNQNKGSLTNNKTSGASRQTTAKNQKQKQQANQSSEQKQKQQNHQQQNQLQQQQQTQNQQQKQPQLQPDQVLTQQSHIPMIGYQPPMTILGQVQLPVTSSEQFKLVPQMDTIGPNLTNNNIQLVNNIDPITSMGNQNHQANSYISSQQQLQPIQHHNQVTHMVHQIHLQHPDQQQHNQLQHSPQEEIQLQNVHQFQEQHQQHQQHHHIHLIHHQQQPQQQQPLQHLKHQLVVTEEPLNAEELEQHLESRRMEQTDLLMPDWDSEVPSEIFGTDSAIKFMAED